MLSSHIVGNHKFVLFIDNIGFERNSEKVFEKLLSEQNVSYEKYNDSLEIINKSAVVIQSISKMNFNSKKSIPSTIQAFKLNKNVTQVFAWATTKNIQDPLTIPFLEHMSNVVVLIKSNTVLSILTKRKFGSVKLKEYQHELIRGSTSIKELKHEQLKVNEEDSIINPEIIGTFKIGEFNSNELEARRNLKLPFEIM